VKRIEFNGHRKLGAIRVAVSSCLLGNEVRYDGSHKHDRYITNRLGLFFNFEPLCPEVAIGMGIPRPPIRLTGDPAAPRVRGVLDPSLDVTDQLADYAMQQAACLHDISGYIFKKGSPSCGVWRVKVYDDTGVTVGQGTGKYAAGIRWVLPNLPVEEEGRLHDKNLRENFLERVYVYRRWQQLLVSNPSARGLAAFHTTHKLLMLSHGEMNCRKLGWLVSGAGSRPFEQTAKVYIELLMETLERTATRRQHASVLYHVMGYYKQRLSTSDKEALKSVIEGYRLGRCPLLAPLSLLRSWQQQYPNPYMAKQIYLNPYPDELRMGR